MKSLSFSLPKYDIVINKLYDEIYDDLHLKDELLRRFPPVRVSHTGTTRWLSKPDVLEAPYKQHRNTTTGEIEMVTKTDAVKFKEFLYNLTTPIQEKVKKHTIEIINQTCDVTSNKIDITNQNVWEAYIQALEMMNMVFDNDGNPNFLIHPPEFYEKLSKTEPTIEQKDKVEEIFRRKREEYNQKIGSRKLVKSSRKIKPSFLNEKIDVNTLKASLSLPKYNSAIIQLVIEVKSGFENLDPLLGKMGSIPVVHGGMTRQVSEPQILETPMKKFSVEISLGLDCFRNTNTEQFRDALWKFSEEATGERIKHFFETFPQICNAAGTSVDAEGKNVWDAYLEMLETLEMHFDENGNHNTELVVHPDTAKKIRANPPTPEQLAKGEAIIERKKKEFYAQKRTRRLS